jgi:transcriptional regulator with XRE-family HTH domain
MPPGNLPQLSALLKTERERAGLTVRQLAEATGLTPSTLWRLETGFIGSPKPDQLQRLAEALGIAVEEFYAAAGFLVPSSLPELRPYLRAKYGLAGDEATRIEGYVQALRDETNHLAKEGDHDDQGDADR